MKKEKKKKESRNMASELYERDKKKCDRCTCPTIGILKW